MKVFFLLLVTFLFLLSPQNIFAESVPQLPTVSVINEIRGNQLGLEKADLLASLKEQEEVTRENNVRATWLWQYSAMEKKELINFAKSEMADQEFGLFLEIDKNTAEKAGIKYKGHGPWYHSDGLLLVSYDQNERRKFIDLFFQKFKEEFGYYPKSVGAWWVGADAINYMREKYKITSVLQCADQFETDAYSLWGTPWSIPYIPSKTNAAIPAQTIFDKQNNVVVLQWAPRDPLRAYGNSVKESTYSVQDMKFPESGYYEYLLNVFLHKPYDQTVVGLEGGLPTGAYRGMYAKQLQTLKAWQDADIIVVQTSEEYADAFLKRNEIFPPTRYFLTKDYKNNDQSFWYHSQHYRVGIFKKGESIYVVDYRNYQNTSSEDFTILPNTQALIRINTNAVIDSIRFPQTEVLLINSNEPLQIKNENKNVALFTGQKKLAEFSEKSTQFYTIPDKTNVSKNFLIVVPPPIQPIIVVGILISYICFLLLRTRNNYVRFIHVTCFMLGLLAITPILTNGLLFSDSYLFDSKFTSFVSLLSWLPVDPAVKIFLTFQGIPLLFIIGMHYLMLRIVNSTIKLFMIFTLLNILFVLYYSNFINEFLLLVTLGKKGALAGIVIVFITAFLVSQIIVLRKTRNRKIGLIGISIILLLFVGIHKDTYFTQKRIIITPFEMEALTELVHQQKPVINVITKFNTEREDYRNIFPIAFTDTKFSEQLTGLSWKVVERLEANDIILTNYKNTSIVVPQYLGGFLYADEINKYKLKRIFDNAQIAIFTTEKN